MSKCLFVRPLKSKDIKSASSYLRVLKRTTTISTQRLISPLISFLMSSLLIWCTICIFFICYQINRFCSLHQKRQKGFCVFWVIDNQWELIQTMNPIISFQMNNISAAPSQLFVWAVGRGESAYTASCWEEQKQWLTTISEHCKVKD